MKTFSGNMVSRLLGLLAALVLAFAQGGAQAQPAYSLSQQELDQMLAPIALYPDALLSQILMAATYPLEVADAARWSGARPGLSGDEAVRAAAAESWDPSVKSLVAFPQVLARMGENPQWTQALGDAFLDQQAEVMDAVQGLRRKAQEAGNLRSDERLSVVESGPRLLLQPFDPQVVYVPYYDPLVVYGSWWWPAYPPVYFRPWPGYYARPAYARGFYWGPPVGISAGFFFGAIDWRRREVRVAQVNNYYYNNPATVRQTNASPQLSVNRPAAWHHDPEHRRGIDYRRAETRANPPVAPAAPIAMRIEGRRSDARPEAHSYVLPARDTVVARPVNVNRVESHQELHANRQAARFEPSARIDVPRAPQPRMAVRPVQSAAGQDPGAKLNTRPRTAP
jgi:hypothetical protein